MCGLLGYLGNPNAEFSWDKFKILALANDARGGDASGIAIKETTVRYDLNTKKFDDILTKYLMPGIGEEDTCIIGQTRKASYGHGTSGLAYSQPIKLIDDNNHPVAIGIHNGTLRNHAELIKEFNVPEELPQLDDNGVFSKVKANDSMVLFYVLAVLKDFSIIKKYRGAATVVWYDVAEDKTYIYVGKSNEGTYFSVERELYWMKNNSGSYYFSSIKKSLQHICEETEDEFLPMEVPPNTLHVFENGKLIESKKGDEFDREEVGKYVAPARVTTVVGQNNAYNGSRSLPPVGLTKAEKFGMLDGGLKIDIPVYLIADRYYYGSQVADGIYTVLEDGSIRIKDGNRTDDTGIGVFCTTDRKTKTVLAHFIDGVKLKNGGLYHELKRLSRYDPNLEFTDRLLEYSQHIVCLDGKYYEWDTDTKKRKLANGNFTTPFSEVVKSYKDGDIIGAGTEQHQFGEMFEEEDNVQNFEPTGSQPLPSDESVQRAIANATNVDEMCDCPECEGRGYNTDKRGDKLWCDFCNVTGQVTKEKYDHWLTYQDEDDDEYVCPACNGVTTGLAVCGLCKNKGVVPGSVRDEFEAVVGNSVHEQAKLVMCPKCEGDIASCSLCDSGMVTLEQYNEYVIQQCTDDEEDEEIIVVDCPACSKKSSALMEWCPLCDGDGSVDLDVAESWEIQQEPEMVVCPGCNADRMAIDICSFCEGEGEVTKDKAETYEKNDIEDGFDMLDDAYDKAVDEKIKDGLGACKNRLESTLNEFSYYGETNSSNQAIALLDKCNTDVTELIEKIN